MMLKIFFCLLLIANGALFAMQRGYLGAPAPERHEPQRLTQQVQPQALSILPPNSAKLVTPVRAAADTVAENAVDTAAAKTASAPAQPPVPAPPAAAAVVTACVEVGNFSAAEAKRFEAQLAGLSLKIKPVQRSIQEAASHMVYIPSQDGKDGADRKAAELRRLGIQDFYVIPESSANPALRWGISLGIFKTEEAAKAYIGQLIPKGVRSARIVARNVSSTKLIFELRDMDAAAQSALDKIKLKFPGQELRPCAG